MPSRSAEGAHPTTRIESAFDEAIARDRETFIAAHHRVQAQLVEERVFFGGEGKVLPVALKPHFLPRALELGWAASIEAIVDVIDRLVAHLLEQPEQVARLGLSDEALALFRIDHGCVRSVVSCRPDILFDGERANIVEINTDSPAMFTFTDVVQRMMLASPPLAEMAEAWQVSSWSRTRDLLAATLAVYRESGGTETSPRIAIVDWDGVMTRFEQATTARKFTALGAPTRVCDPRSLRLSGGRLIHADGEVIDIVQRRVLFPDFLKRPDELGPLLQAYRDRSVCMVNPLRAYLVGNKSLLALLQTEWAQAVVGKHESVEKMLPEALFVSRDNESRILAERDRWVVKRAFGSGGQDVVLGGAVDDAAWGARIAKAMTEPSIVQRQVAIPTYRLPVVDGDDVRLEPRYINWNPWVFGGTFAGATSRASTSAIISITQGGALLPTLTAGREPDEP